MAQAETIKNVPASVLTLDKFDIKNVRLSLVRGGNTPTQQYGYAIKLAYIHDPEKPTVTGPLIFQISDVNTTGVKTFYDDKTSRTSGVTISIKVDQKSDLFKQLEDVSSQLANLLTQKCAEFDCVAPRLKKGEANWVMLDPFLKEAKPKDGEVKSDVRYLSLKLPYYEEKQEARTKSFRCSIYFTNDFEVQKFREVDHAGNGKNKKKIVYKKQPIVQVASDGRLESLITTNCNATSLGFRIGGWWVDTRKVVTWRLSLEYSYCTPTDPGAASNGVFVESDTDEFDDADD